MKKEFVTLYGKAIVERDVLYIRHLDVPFSRTPFARIGLELCFVIIFLLQLFRESYPLYYVGIIVWGAMLAFRIPGFYDLIFKRSYANRIPLKSIKSVETKNSSDDLHTYVYLHLYNGRYREIVFRKLENQHELFAETLLVHSSGTQLA